MANAVYRPYREAAVSGGSNVDLSSEDVKVGLVGSSYTFDQDHDFVDDLGANLLFSSPNLGSKTFTDALFDAADTTVSSVSSNWSYIVVYVDTGSNSTSRLVSYHDTGFTPPTANGSDVDVAFPNGIVQF